MWSKESETFWCLSYECRNVNIECRLSFNEITENEITENEITENEITENEITED